MNLREALTGVTGYRHTAGKQQPAQRWLDRVPTEIDSIPLGFRVRTSGKAQTIPVVPWIALLNIDVTTTAKEGLYLVYLFDASIEHVYLSMNQGVTQHLVRAEEKGLRGKRAKSEALSTILEATASVRSIVCPPDSELSIELGTDGTLAREYEAGSICALRYPLSDLPTLQDLEVDLQRYMDVYAECVDVWDQLAVNQTVTTAARARKQAPVVERTPVFRPKNADEYLARIAPHLQTRTRTHETLVRRFGEEMQGRGYTAATNVHPRDLTLDGTHGHWLVEMKTTRGGIEAAVRDAIGQLFAYRHFLYREQAQPDPHLLAVFDGPVGDAFLDLLDSLGIGAVWLDGGAWQASGRATALLAH